MTFKHSCERLGYFSQIQGDPGDPVFRRLNIEELKKINGTGGLQKTAFDCNKQVDELGGVSASVRLKTFFDKKMGNTDFDVVCYGNALTKIDMPPETKEDLVKKPTIFSVRREQRNMYLEEIEGIDSAESSSKPLSQPSEHNLPSINAGMYADVHLTKLLDEKVGQEKNFGESKLYIFVKHRFQFKDKTVVNLFVSNEIDAVEFNNDSNELVSVDVNYTYGCAGLPQYWSRTQMVKNFLANRICHVNGIMSEDNKIVKATVIDCVGSICSEFRVVSFKNRLADLLHALVVPSDGTVVTNVEVIFPNITLSSETGSKLLPNLVRKAGYMRNLDCGEVSELKYDPNDPHTLLIVGSITSHIALKAHHFHTDVVSINNFRRKLFSSFMCKPEKIVFYGKKTEWKTVGDAMSIEEREIASFVEVE